MSLESSLSSSMLICIQAGIESWRTGYTLLLKRLVEAAILTIFV